MRLSSFKVEEALHLKDSSVRGIDCRGEVIKEAGRPVIWVESWFHHFQTRWPWVSYLTSLSLSSKLGWGEKLAPQPALSVPLESSAETQTT